MSPSPAEIQLALAERILGGEAPELETWIEVPPGADAGERLSAHVGGYPARICESLRESFPALAHILGDASFAELAERYLPFVPAGETNLNFVGSALPEFAAGDPLARALPFLPDLARYEWSLHVCFHARLVEPFDAADCADWTPQDWSQARIAFQPGTALVRSAWPLRSLRACRHVARGEVDVDLEGCPESVLVHRAGLDVVTRAVGDLEAEALERLLAGECLGEVLSAFTARGANAGEVSGLFARWAGAGLVADCGVL